jgi:hypothetical protein
MYTGVGYALVMIGLASEVMPCFTGLDFMYKFSIACLGFLLGLDLYWVKKCMAAWNPPPQRLQEIPRP